MRRFTAISQNLSSWTLRSRVGQRGEYMNPGLWISKILSHKVQMVKNAHRHVSPVPDYSAYYDWTQAVEPREGHHRRVTSDFETPTLLFERTRRRDASVAGLDDGRYAIKGYDAWNAERNKPPAGGPREKAWVSDGKRRWRNRHKVERPETPRRQKPNRHQIRREREMDQAAAKDGPSGPSSEEAAVKAPTPRRLEAEASTSSRTSEDRHRRHHKRKQTKPPKPKDKFHGFKDAVSWFV